MNQPQPQAPMAGQTAGDKDYLDKALDFIEKKFGGARFRDPNNPQNRAMNEKITDGIRKVVEKLTGRKAPAKFSN